MAERKKTNKQTGKANTDKPTKRSTAKKKPIKKTKSKKVTAKTQGRLKRIKNKLLTTIWNITYKGSLALITIIVFYFIYLDSKISRQFEGNKWQLPVQVYARAMQFSHGQYLSLEEVLWELKKLNYSQVNRISKTGQYVLNDKIIKIRRRAFEFYDGKQAASTFSLTFSNKKLQRIVDENNNSLKQARLEPVQIARIGNDSKQDREFVPLAKFPNILKAALLEVEDRDFYSHHGVSLWSIARALYTNIKAGKTVQGGSTLTQQLAKNFYLTRKRTLIRKINEAFIALILDYRYSKDQILEAYLNEVYLGQAYNQGVHGMGLASDFYFAKPVDELEFDQIALLVAMVKGPSYYNPRRYPERAQQRRDLVLRLLAEGAYITTNEYRLALNRPIQVEPLKNSKKKSYPGYLELVNRELSTVITDKETVNAGVRIFTYFDLQKQTAMENAISDGVPYLERRYKTTQLETAMISANLKHAGVSALVPGTKVRFNGFNRALDTKRNIGSLVKPAIYLSALEQPNYNLGTLLDDNPLQVTDESGNTWQPENFDKKFRGSIALYQAFSRSVNVPAVNLGLDVGVHVVANTLTLLGVKQVINQYPSLLLGALELSSFEVLQIYSTLANNGVYTPLTSISAITDVSGNVLYKHKAKGQRKFSEEAAFMTKYGLKKVTKTGTAKRLNQHFPAIQLAGKTGTSNDLRDSWFAGFDHNTVTVTWLGRDDNRSTQLTGAKGALELYIRYLKPLNPQAIADERPQGIKWAFINELTGKQAPPGCGSVIQLPIRASEFEARPKC